MKRRALDLLEYAAIALAVTAGSQAQPAPQILQLNPASMWSSVEFAVTNVPSTSNPFDPDIIRVDVDFTSPSERVLSVPAFWYQGYQRGLAGGSESLKMAGSPGWRLRFTPTEAGTYSCVLLIRTNGLLYGAPVLSTFLSVTNLPMRSFGFVRNSAAKQNFETSDGRALPLIGENVCWPGARGTFDYDDWFSAMQGAGENYARIWMCPWAFGIETDANSLTRYRLDRAWQLDYVLQLAEQHGIYLLLCLDYHGMFEVKPDYWGGNNFWPANPYNSTNGGPCLNQNAFFTNSAAQSTYQKRLRYLIARYGYSANLIAWQFLNEIDNVYAYLNPKDVAAWHAIMGEWLHTNDPFRHLVTTSLTGGSDRPEIWTLPQLDFAAYHSYGEPSPGMRLSAVAQSFLQRYGKPVLIDEFGTDWRGWNQSNDPYLRGFRQGLWGGALGGSAGTAISWWWEYIHSENLYPAYAALGSILKRTGWERGTWTNITFAISGAPPKTVGALIPGGQPFDVFLPVNEQWGAKPPGQLALPNANAAGLSASALNSFVQGTAHPDLKVPFRLSVWLTNNARLVMHLNSVSSGASMVVRADGTELFRTNLPNLDGGYGVNNEYNLDIPVNLPAGQRLIEVTNAGIDWFFLDWVRVENLLPAAYSVNWAPSPDAIGLRGPHESLLYIVAPGVSFPGNATNATLPLQHSQTVVLTNWPSGPFFAEWYAPAVGIPVGYSQADGSNNCLTLTMPDYSEDLAAVVYPRPVLKAFHSSPAGQLGLELLSETGGRYLIEKSETLSGWSPFLNVTNSTGTVQISNVPTGPNSRCFFRAKQERRGQPENGKNRSILDGGRFIPQAKSR